MDMGSELRSVGDLPPDMPDRGDFEGWRAWAIRVENDPGAYSGEIVVFRWSCGASSCVRFETACRCWNRGTEMWNAGKLREAYAAFGDCAFEILAWKTRPEGTLPGLDDCGKARLRCLIRLQRAALRRFDVGEAEDISKRALWLWAAEETLRALGGKKVEDPVGKRLFLAARAIAADKADRCDDAAVLARLAIAEEGTALTTELDRIRRRCGDGRRTAIPLRGDLIGKLDWDFCFG